jgi:RNA-splicing ligase RtcB
VKKKVKKTIEEFGRKEGLEEEIVKARKSVAFIPEKLRYLEGHEAEDYLHDMKICQQWAEANREAIVNEIVLRMGLTIVDSFETVHNYINFEDNILRKGAISAHEGEKLLIPLNMRDGCILGVGKGNQDWNFSAPHGAGRIMSRSEAKKKVSLSEFENSMKGVFSTSVGIDTLDESPMAYKPIEAILDVVGETIEIVNLLKPVYNFKAGEK